MNGSKCSSETKVHKSGCRHPNRTKERCWATLVYVEGRCMKVSTESYRCLQERQLTLINHEEGSWAQQIHSTFYFNHEHLTAMGGGSGDGKGHWFIHSSGALRRGPGRDAEEESHEGTVPLSFVSRESAFLGSLGIMKNKSWEIKKTPTE